MVDRDMHSGRLPTRRERKILSKTDVTEHPVVVLTHLGAKIVVPLLSISFTAGSL